MKRPQDISLAFKTPIRICALVIITAVLVTASLAWCFGLGLFGANLGTFLHLVGIDAQISVSLEMGALIAGMTIATFPYASDVVGKIANLRDFFVTLFFVALVAFLITRPAGKTTEELTQEARANVPEAGAEPAAGEQDHPPHEGHEEEGH